MKAIVISEAQVSDNYENVENYFDALMESMPDLADTITGIRESLRYVSDKRDRHNDPEHRVAIGCYIKRNWAADDDESGAPVRCSHAQKYRHKVVRY